MFKSRFKTKMNPMMVCGHAANATTEGKPCCAICIGLRPGSTTIAKEAISLKDRTATCGGHNPKPSNTNLAFFFHRPDKETDEYYCGCHGWD